MSDTSTTARQPLHLYLREKASVMSLLKHFSMEAFQMYSMN